MGFLFSNEKLKSLQKTTIKFKPLQGLKAADQFFNCSTSSVLAQSHFSFPSRLQMPLMESHVSGHGTQLTREFVKASVDHLARAFGLWKTKAAQVVGYWSRSPVHLASLLFLSRFCVQTLKPQAPISNSHTCGVRASLYVDGNIPVLLDNFTNQTYQNNTQSNRCPLQSRLSKSNFGSNGLDVNSVVPSRDTQQRHQERPISFHPGLYSIGQATTRSTAHPAAGGNLLPVHFDATKLVGAPLITSG